MATTTSHELDASYGAADITEFREVCAPIKRASETEEKDAWTTILGFVSFRSNDARTASTRPVTIVIDPSRDKLIIRRLRDKGIILLGPGATTIE